MRICCNLVQVGEHNEDEHRLHDDLFLYANGLQDLLGLTDANSNIRSYTYENWGKDGVIDRSSCADEQRRMAHGIAHTTMRGTL